MPICEEAEVGLLLGYNCDRVLIPREVVAADSGPFAQRTDLGWGIIGVVDYRANEDSYTFVTVSWHMRFMIKGSIRLFLLLVQRKLFHLVKCSKFWKVISLTPQKV